MRPTASAVYGDLGETRDSQLPKTMAKWALGLALSSFIPLVVSIATGLAVAVLIRGRDGRDHGTSATPTRNPSTTPTTSVRGSAN